MSEIRVNKVINEAGTGSVELTHGGTIPSGKYLSGAGGVIVGSAVTASAGFVGNLTGNVTGDATGLTGTPNITVNAITAASGSVSGNFSVAGVLTYEDVTNIDSVGLITARNGLNVLAGVTSMTGGVRYNGGGSLREKVKVTAGKLSDNLNIDLADGMVHLFTVAETATSTPNIRVSASKTLASELEVGEQVSVSVVTTAAAAAFSANWTIDGGAVTEVWSGAAAPSAGGAAGKDFYSLNIIKVNNTGTPNTDFTVLANLSNFA